MTQSLEPRGSDGYPVRTRHKTVRYKEPEPGWREAQQQCSQKGGYGGRCRALATQFSPYCQIHDDARSIHRMVRAINRGELKERALNAVRDPQVLNMRAAVGTAEALVEELLSRFNDDVTPDPTELREVIKDLDLFTRMQERGSRVEIEQQASWGAAEIRAFLQLISQGINRFVKDERDRGSLLDFLKAQMSGLDINAALPEAQVIDAEA